MVRGFKSAVGKRMNEIANTPSAAVWQRNYFEHVIRDDDDYNRIAEYVENNPQRWMEDSLHP
jgi:REP element-mobilizing transposase RayT